jgi:hypothetical protein
MPSQVLSTATSLVRGNEHDVLLGQSVDGSSPQVVVETCWNAMDGVQIGNGE